MKGDNTFFESMMCYRDGMSVSNRSTRSTRRNKLHLSEVPSTELESFRIFDSFGRGFLWGKVSKQSTSKRLFTITPEIIHMACAGLRSIYNFIFFLRRRGEITVEPEAARCLFGNYGPAEAARILGSRILQQKGYFNIVVEALCQRHNTCTQHNMPYSITRSDRVLDLEVPLDNFLYDNIDN